MVSANDAEDRLFFAFRIYVSGNRHPLLSIQGTRFSAHAGGSDLYQTTGSPFVGCFLLCLQPGYFFVI